MILNLTADGPDNSVHQPNSFQATRQVVNCSAGQLRNLLSVAPQITITANGTSMTPFICNGGRVTLRNTESPLPLKRGEIILFTDPAGNLLLHRIVGTPFDGKRNMVQTKGDNRFCADTAISSDKVIATVARLEKVFPVVGRCSFNLESRSGKLVGQIQAWISRLNIHLRLRSVVSKVKNCISLSC